ncbi:MAG: type III-B CRISPR module-associated protein Cmr5 [Candidatus Brocadia sp.]|nr:type III-B CRISPR module-associated protein Cmr5 [Candidatus Brocadia sp.]UJS16952.1 MAG: type III-B CRISPR module-associated protein Cmr5 [Candidatus Jettenia sp.]
MSRLQKVEQKRAAEAWSCIQAVNEDIDSPKFKKEYRSIVMKLPTLILTNGLGQTLAFLKSKGKNDDSNPEEKVYGDLQGWLTQPNVANWGRVMHDELIERIMAIDSNKYRFVTMECLSFLNWLKRFADAVLPKDGGE